jgi:Domain of unknown function (DUF3560)
MSEHQTAPTPGLAVDIVAAIDRLPGITVPEIAVKLGVPPSAVYGEMAGIAQAIVKVDRRFYSPGSEPQPPALPAPSPTAPAAPAEPAAAPSAELIISHTNTEGTLVHGTSKGDGSNTALKAARLKWSRNLGAWFMPQSRGRAAKRGRIAALASSLETAGFTVTVDIKTYDAGEAFAALQSAGEERADALAETADRERARSDGSYAASHKAIEGIPVGQPVLVGHHSEGRHRRDLARSDSHMRQSIEHGAKADRASERSDAALRQAARRENPVVMGRRVERLEARQRELTRWLQGAGEAPLMRGELADVEQEIAFLRQSIEESGVQQFTKADFQKGDLARIRGRWGIVAKANAKTLAIETGYSWTDKYPYHEVTGRQRPGENPAQTADASKAASPPDDETQGRPTASDAHRNPQP